MTQPIITPLVTLSEVGGAQWRLAMDETAEHQQPLVRLERLEPIFGEPTWTHVKHITANLAEVGVERRGQSVILLDDKKAKARLQLEMSALGHAPLFVHEMVGDQRPPVIAEPDLDGHVRANLLELVLRIEAKAAAATAGEWYASDERAAGVALSAVITGAPTDPVAESMSREDQDHVISTQPMVAGALCRKLREAFYLLQNSGKLALMLRQAVDRLMAETPGPASISGSWLEGINAMMATMALQMSAFPIVQVPQKTPDDVREWKREVLGQWVGRPPISRAKALEIARSAARAHEGDADSNKWPPEWVVTAIIEASR
ncbi:MAG TPA: hypothetical protein VJZ73_13280 [Methylomirabilota bacterium]|nr:hypothetical protein [Methylomirabilota bacterium]